MLRKLLQKIKKKLSNEYYHTNIENGILKGWDYRTAKSLPVKTENLDELTDIKSESSLLVDNVEHADIKSERQLVIDLGDKIPIKQIIMQNDAEIEKMVLRKDGCWQCAVCGKITSKKSHITEHAESHIEGISYPCDFCGKTLKNRMSYRLHVARIHKSVVGY